MVKSEHSIDGGSKMLEYQVRCEEAKLSQDHVVGMEEVEDEVGKVLSRLDFLGGGASRRSAAFN